MKIKSLNLSEKTKHIISRTIHDLSYVFWSWITIDILLRIYELTTINISYFSQRSDYKDIFHIIALLQVHRIFYFFLYLAPAIVAASFLSEKKKRLLGLAIAGIYMFLQLSLIEYLRNAGIPLNETIYSYSLDEVLMISKISSTTNFYLFGGVWLLIFTLYYWATRCLQRYYNHNYTIILLVSLFTVCIPFKSTFGIKAEQFEDEINYYIGEDKLWYFINKSVSYYEMKHFEFQPSFQELVPEIKKYQSMDTTRNYTNPVYPFLYKSERKDVLGTYFHLKEEKPNIVFIIVEGLGKDFQGDDAYIGSFTPFLDSLAKQSLYWPNFLSTATRTFGVLPTSLGSLPYGESGFQLIEKLYPNHNTLISILVNSGYTANFFYGGWNGFENMNKFLKTNGVSYFSTYFGKQYKKLGTEEDSWGYNDESVFYRSVELIDSLKEKQPRLNIFMTLNVHNPWNLNDGGKYLKMTSERINTLERLNRLRKDSLISQEICATIMSSDDAIRRYFEKIKTDETFNNTIFIIYGDHHLGYLKKASVISAYHIPLIIYSPMLIKAQRFNSVSSQLDIVPSILALLGSKYQISEPKEVHWLGDGLDTAIPFRNRHFIPMMNSGKNVNTLLHGNYFLTENSLFKLNSDMTLSPVINDSIRDEMLVRIKSFAKLNKYVCTENKLFP